MIVKSTKSHLNVNKNLSEEVKLSKDYVLTYDEEVEVSEDDAAILLTLDGVIEVKTELLDTKEEETAVDNSKSKKK